MKARNFKHWFFVELSTGKRRFIIMLIAAVLIFSLFYAGGMSRESNRIGNKTNTVSYEIKTPEMAQEVMSEKLSDELRTLSRKIEVLERQARNEEAKKEKGETAPNQSAKDAGSSAFSSSASTDELQKLLNADTVLAPTDELYMPSLQYPQAQGKTEDTPHSEPISTGQNDHNNQEQQVADNEETTAQTPQPSLGVISYQKKAESKPSPAPKAITPSFYIPSASFFSVKILTGLDAPTGQKAKNNPSPMALRIQDLAWLPNEVRSDVQGCFILAEAIGDLSTERVNARGLSISCVDKTGNRVIDQKLLGYVADSDGKAGLRGVIVNKAGKVLAETMKVGFLQGLSDFFQYTARDFTAGSDGAVYSSPTDKMQDNILGGAFSGASDALKDVSDYYMSLAEDIFPVIQINATRSASFIVTQGMQVNFDKILSQRADKQEDSNAL